MRTAYRIQHILKQERKQNYELFMKKKYIFQSNLAQENHLCKLHIYNFFLKEAKNRTFRPAQKNTEILIQTSTLSKYMTKHDCNFIQVSKTKFTQN